jgi:putative oxidoreductase
MTSINATLGRYRAFAPLLLRLGIGVVMTYHGIDKFRGGLSGVEEMFTMWGVPAAGIAAPVVALVEVVAGSMLILGIGTRIAATALAGVLVGAILYVKIDLGLVSSGPMPGAELDIALLSGLVALVLIGPGPVSADHALGLEPATDEVASPTAAPKVDLQAR